MSICLKQTFAGKENTVPNNVIRSDLNSVLQEGILYNADSVVLSPEGATFTIWTRVQNGARHPFTVTAVSYYIEKAHLMEKLTKNPLYLRVVGRLENLSGHIVLHAEHIEVRPKHPSKEDIAVLKYQVKEFAETGRF